jgi:hypothetical protein
MYTMALSPRRYAEVELQLQQVETELVELAGELSQVRPADDHSCRPGQVAKKAADKVSELRYLLAVAEARRQIGEKQRAPSLFTYQDMEPTGAPTRRTPVRSALPALKWLTTLLDAPSRRSKAV